MQINIDITEVAGPKLADLRNIGMVPDGIDGGRDLHVSNPSGSKVIVRDYNTDELIVSGNGWSNAMQALANHYQLPVIVSCDAWVSGGKSSKVTGTWTPAPIKLSNAQLMALAAMRIEEAAGRRLSEGSVATTPTINALEAAKLVTVERWAAHTGIGSRYDRRKKLTQTWSAALTTQGADLIAARHDMQECEQMVQDAKIAKAKRGLATSARQLGTQRPDLTRFAQEAKKREAAATEAKTTDRYRVYVVQQATLLRVDSVNVDATSIDDAALQIARRMHIVYPHHLYAAYTKVDGRDITQRFSYNATTDTLTVA